ncbi:MAG: Flp pilus assembly complex ATPase component TadA, partial [Lachnospiraceae bacterium]|nr:Flp pilus assembly complex ATPase component TadA [Lachnospiraceae bacterium]
MSDRGIKETIEEALGEYCREFYVPLAQRQNIYKEIFYQLRALDILQELVENPEVTEIMVNGPDNIFIEKAGRIMKWNRSFSAPDKLDNVIQQIVGFCNRVVNESSPIVDARLPDGSRVNVVLKPVALN